MADTAVRTDLGRVTSAQADRGLLNAIVQEDREMTVTFSKLGISGLLLSAVVVFGLACRDEKPTSEVLTLEGTVEKVTAQADGTGEIVVRYYSSKHQKEVEGTGLVTKETRILVDGQIAPLADVKPGEPVTGEVRVERTGKAKKLIVLRIQVDRAAPQGD